MKILLATDGSKYSDFAVEMATRFQFSEKSEINLVSIVDLAAPLSIDMYEGFLPSTLEIAKTAKESAKNILEETKAQILAKFPTLEVTTNVLIGAPERRIVERAEEIGAELIIVGSHGYNRWERLLLGSVSDSVVHHAPCSVLIVRSSDVN